jgi:hypothetical protein
MLKKIPDIENFKFKLLKDADRSLSSEIIS